jgi:hypothetical protein
VLPAITLGFIARIVGRIAAKVVTSEVTRKPPWLWFVEFSSGNNQATILLKAWPNIGRAFVFLTQQKGE